MVLVFASGSRPSACRNGHPWKGGTIIVGWMPCDCPSALARNKGHHWVRCMDEFCNEIWYDPPHHP